MKVIDKIALIILENGKILSTKSFGKNKYYIPGGKRENNDFLLVIYILSIFALK